MGFFSGGAKSSSGSGSGSKPSAATTSAAKAAVAKASLAMPSKVSTQTKPVAKSTIPVQGAVQPQSFEAIPPEVNKTNQRPADYVAPAQAVAAPVVPIVPPIVPQVSAVKQGAGLETMSIDDDETEKKYAKPIRAWAQDW